MKSYLLLLLFVSVVFLSGCEQYYYQEVKTFTEASQDRKECREELLRRYDLKGFTKQYEVEFMENCMKEKGYSIVNEGTLPIEAKRERPQTSLHWTAKGVAGTIE
ncbi:MAG: hypothetical protein ACYSSP_02330 [Planctomycetota bacterium]|jgi:hypothetical protein